MSNSAKNALQKIIAAFGSSPKPLTRIQIFAKVARLSNDIEEKRLYPDISEEERLDILNKLKKYFLFYKAEEYLIHQILFYPRAFVYWALRKLDPSEQTRQATQRNITAFTKEASNVRGYTDVFADCLQELQQNPDNYPSVSLHEILGDLSGASRIGMPLLRAHFRIATGYTRNETMALQDSLSRFSHAHDDSLVTSAIHKKYAPSVGPDTPEELYLTLIMLYNYGQHPLIPKTFAFREMMASFGALIDLSRFICRDIPQKNLDDQFRIFPVSPLTFMAKARMDYSESVTNALAMGRYFVERHRDKLGTQGTIALSEALADLYIKSFFYAEESKAKFGAEPLNDAYTERLIQRMLHERWVEWQRPSVDEIILQIDGQLKGKNKLKFHTILEQSEPYFDMQVSYYMEQSDIIKRLRRNLFKNGSIGQESEGYRTTFIKGLTETHRDKLMLAGFCDEEINFMARTGKLLQRDDLQSDWNVDHVVDIHAGGTNSSENLCLMPAHLNQMKNSFLLLQTSMYPDVNRGFWVLTLRPKLGLDGKPASILMEKSKPVTAPLLPENKGPL